MHFVPWSLSSVHACVARRQPPTQRIAHRIGHDDIHELTRESAVAGENDVAHVLGAPDGLVRAPLRRASKPRMQPERYVTRRSKVAIVFEAVGEQLAKRHELAAVALGVCNGNAAASLELRSCQHILTRQLRIDSVIA